ncbi:universal stress protein [Sphingomonas hylomeconis]|uniref:Universal stress protein n=1 Tax=Sphingomonas hylomeconis TaxID=1395958 RepID=A0ABV7SXQ1_9SPHN|nr:universal stress protein [Sphingomonas hylomeconis]
MRRLLAVTTSCDPSHAAIERAGQLAARDCADLRLIALLPHDTPAADCAAATAALDDRAEALAARRPCIASLTARATAGEEAAVMLAEAADYRADMIVLPGPADNGAAGLAAAAIDQVVRTAIAPVLIVQAPPERPYRRLLVAVDDDPTAEAVLHLACLVDSAAEIIAVHAYQPGVGGADAAERAEHEARLAAMLHAVVAQHPAIAARCTAIAVPGPILSVLVGATLDHAPDLLVLGTHARHGIALLLHGSVARSVVAALPFDILVGHVGGKDHHD